MATPNGDQRLVLLDDVRRPRHGQRTCGERAGDVAAGLAPDGVVRRVTNYGAPGYGGPCPPEDHGIHQYVITVHALRADTLGLDADTNPAIVGYTIWSHTIAKASVVMYYERRSS
ncbi:MAG: hypothetical protein AAF730_03765 [Bacteroidota bacterium]